MPYSSEAAFSRALVPLLNDQFRCVQRIESGETGRGIPDIYIRGRRHELWVELKNMKHCSIYDGSWEVPWRQGQQAWHLNYYKAGGWPVLTIVALRDGFMVILMTKRFKRNIVLHHEVTLMTSIRDVLNILVYRGSMYDLQR